MLKAKLIKQKRIYTLLIISSLAVGCLAQTQKGFVKTLGRPNQKGVALSGVTIRMKEAHNAVLSKDDGTFSVQIQGESYSLQQVQKSGYELNEKGVIGRKYAYSAQVPLTIVMVSTQQLQSDKQRIENNAYQVAEKNYQTKLAQLEKQKADNAITIEQYRQQIQELQDKFEKYQSLIDGLADHYAHVDYDELDEKEREINLCIENGDLEQADQLLQQLGIQQRITDIDNRLAAGLSLMDEANNDMAAVLKQQEKDAEYLYQLYTIALAKFDNEKARTYIETRAALDTTNVEWQIKAGDFINEYVADYEKAKAYFQVALNNSISQYGEKSEWGGHACNNIGMVYAYQGNYPEAMDWFNKVLSMGDSIGQESIPIAEANNNIGVILFYQEEYDKALGYLLKGLDIRNILLGPEHPDVAQSYNNIGGIYDNKGDFPNAMENYTKALNIRVKILGPEHPDVAQSYNSIANVYEAEGKTDLALEFYSKALVIREKTKGKEHPDVASSYVNVASIYVDLCKFDEALIYYNKALAIFKKIYGEKHPYLGITYGHLGKLYSQQDNYPKSLEYYFISLPVLEEAFGPDHTNIGIIYHNIGTAYERVGKYSDALDYYTRALSIIEKSLGNNHPSTQQVREAIVEVSGLIEKKKE